MVIRLLVLILFKNKKTKGTAQRLFANLSYPLPLGRFITFDLNTLFQKINLDLRPLGHIWIVHIPEGVVPGIHTQVHILPGIGFALALAPSAVLFWRAPWRRADQRRAFNILLCRWSDMRIAGLTSHDLQHHTICSRALNAGIVRFASHNIHNYRSRSAE
jgi:hypothetical protein